MALRAQTGPYFGDFGGRFVPESLVAALDELGEAYDLAKLDPAFGAELAELGRSYTGRPSIITEVPRFAEHAGDARIILKREDLNHTGSHKINNVLGQALLTKRIGKSRVIAETGAGQHGVATATAAALFGLDCTVYMGEVDTERQALNVARMRLLGAEVIAVKRARAPSRTRSTRPCATGSRTSRPPTTSSARSPVRTRSPRWCATSRRSSARRPASRSSTSPARCRRRSRVRRRRLERHRHLPRVPRRHRGRPLRLRGRRRGRRHRAPRRDDHEGPPRRAARRPQLPPAGRGRPDHRVALDLRRPRLPGRRPRALLARGDRARPVPSRSRMPPPWRRCACSRAPRASSPRSSRRTPWRARSSSAASSAGRRRSS